MNPRAIFAVVLAFAMGVAVGRLWTSFADGPENRAPAAAQTSGTTPVPPSVKPAPPVVVNAPPPKSERVELPVLPPATPQTTTNRAASTEQLLDEAATRSQERAVRNNLRQFSSAAAQYMIERGVTQASYYDIVGTTTDAYLRPIQPVAGEDYTGLVMHQTDSQIEVQLNNGASITFEQ